MKSRNSIATPTRDGMATSSFEGQLSGHNHLSTIYTGYGHAARAQQDWGTALIHYRRSLELIDSDAARIGAADAMLQFVPELAVLRGHRTGVISVAFSPDGKHLASGAGRHVRGSDHTVRLWDMGTGSITTISEKLKFYAEVGLPYILDDNGQIVWKDPIALAKARLDAAKTGRILWREDGGKSLVPLYENELEQAQRSAGGGDGVKPDN
jgi:WD40 repeat protein